MHVPSQAHDSFVLLGPLVDVVERFILRFFLDCPLSEFTLEFDIFVTVFSFLLLNFTLVSIYFDRTA